MDLNPKWYKSFRYSLILLAILPFLEIGWKSAGDTFAFVGYIALPLVFLFFAYNSFYYIKFNHLTRLMTTSHLFRVRLYLLLVSFLVLYGLVRGNSFSVTLSQAFLYFTFGFFLVLGVDDRVCNLTFNIASVSICLSAICALFTLNIKSSIPSYDPFAGEDMRFTDSFAFQFHPFFILCLPVFLFGWVSKIIWWKNLKAASLLPYLFFELVIFKFRSSLFMMAMVFIVALLMPSSLKTKIKFIILMSIVFCGVLFWFDTQNGIVFIERMGQFGSTGMVGYRWPESQRFFDEVGYEWLWGRGIGGGFNLGNLFHMASFVDDSNWQILHIGWFTFLLKGGIPFLLITLSFWIAGIRQKYQWSLENKYNVVAKFWCPIMFVIWLLNPFLQNFSAAFVLGLTFLLLARFGKRPMVIETVR